MKVSWDVKEVQSQHSDYVDHVLRQLQAFNQSLARRAAIVPMPADLTRLIWTLAAKVMRAYGTWNLGRSNKREYFLTIVFVVSQGCEVSHRYTGTLAGVF